MIIYAEEFKGNKKYNCGSVAGALDEAIRENSAPTLLIEAVVNKFDLELEWNEVRSSLDSVKKNAEFNIFTKVDRQTGFMTIKTSSKG
tara:strand:- start:12 stop:275 length:264 start_codon:yes stop_codon:yes gene_type:complete